MTTPDVHALESVLRRAFKSPREVWEKLGLDASLLRQEENDQMSRPKVSRRVATAVGALAYYARPLLAQDAALTGQDLVPVFDGVTAKNWREKRPDLVSGVAKLLDGKLAKDQATPDDVALRLIDLLDGQGGGGESGLAGLGEEEEEEGMDKSVSEAQHRAMGAAAGGNSQLGIPQEVGKEFMRADKGKFGAMNKDEDVGEKVCEFLAAKGVDPAILEELKAHLATHVAEDEEEGGGAGLVENPNKNPVIEKGGVVGHHQASDEPPPFEGMPKVGEGPSNVKAQDADCKPAQDSRKKPAMDQMITKVAMDAAIRSAVAAENKRQREVREAEKMVRPYIGDLAIACDSAEAVYEAALRALGIKVDGVHPSAFKTILEMQPKGHSERRSTPTMSMDAATAKNFADRFPAASRIKVL